MKKLLLLVPAFFVALVLNAQTQQTQSTDQTQTQKDITKVVEFKELDHDFGKIPFGKHAEFDLEMKNISSDSIVMTEVKVGCGCTEPKPRSGGPYAPGETFKVTIGFNGATDGEFQKYVTIFFGDLSQVIKFHGQTYKTPDNAAPGNATIEKLKPTPNQ